MTIELAVTPSGPYSLPFSARIAGDATRTFRDGLFTQVLEIDGRVEVARAWQAPQGVVTIVAESAAGATGSLKTTRMHVLRGTSRFPGGGHVRTTIGAIAAATETRF